VPVTFGAADSQVVVPGAAGAADLTIDRDEVSWRAVAAAGAGVRLNGERLREPRDLTRGDVLTIGEAQIVVRAAQPGSLALDVLHLAGNDTIAPLAPPAESAAGLEDEDVEISAAARAAPEVALAAGAGRRRTLRNAAIGVSVALVALTFALLATLARVPLVLEPGTARVRAADTLLSWQSGTSLFVLAGEHTLRASAEGYEPADRKVLAARDGTAPVRFRLAKQPGILRLDTGGVAASVSVDGTEVGRAPGDVRVAAGKRSLTLRAERHLDAVVDVDVEGLGRRQDIKVAMKPSWGAVVVTVRTPGAQLSVDGAAPAAIPPRLELPAGVHRLRISAPQSKDWESAIVVKAGETLTVGPIDLGAPDARVAVRSVPSGADVSVDGAYRGRTPLEIDVSPGSRHDVLVARTGYESWSRSIDAKSGERTVLEARLAPIFVALTVTGEPADAEVLVDGVVQGRAPGKFDVLAGERSVEVRKAGLAPYKTRVSLAPGLARTVEYQLHEPGRPSSVLAGGSQVGTKIGYTLKLVKPGSFVMGSERREQGRRPNEGRRPVTLSRSFYIGTTEVTNAQFRRFRAEHESGYIDKKSADLDAQPVARVTWNDAVEFCNWLSGQEGLPAAYEKKDGRWVLASPPNNGFRLPTEAEWEYAARFTGTGSFRRYPWGDALPIAPNSGNFAGVEAQGTMTPILESYRDDYPGVAPIGRFGPNALGLTDMAGNLSEWVHDWYASFIDGSPQTDPLGPAEGTRHTIRGSSWRTNTVADLRLAWRDGATDGAQHIGFRVARYADP
jgi:formylglycine-generating enzyme required for sulfatase activity